ncbi:riboflavin synthase alpha chain [Paramicrobacterium humi]|uniref:Riboflavin synthase n=1 Tax=Paramicrobacterium humi TaxID=640635 RepID=A0A1H4IUI9_9MICO|nr:riboflavin synthase [Microbacterium humi]SEB37667.1 riboflavin synthase alpha chain [Microbacterium humi]
MFTGIIEEIGTVASIERRGSSLRLTVRGPLAVSDAGHGDSIAVSGVCLTVVEHDAESFTADVMGQTLAVSTFEHIDVGDAVNLERAASVGERLGGHIVQGHVDGTARVASVRDEENWRVLRFHVPAEHARLIVDKGSVAVDGTSLTVSAVAPAELSEQWFEVSLIPETLTATTLGALTVGDTVNVETDIIARHVERMLARDAADWAEAGRSDS